GKIDFAEFYARRIKRLFPGIISLLLACILLWAALLAGPRAETDKFIKSMRYSVAGIANVYFARNTGGYFDGASDELPLLHFWSLAVEEQFYLIYPLIMLLGFRFLAHSKSDQFRQRIFKGLIVLCALSFLAAELLLRFGFQKSAFYMMPARAWELGVGGTLVFATPMLSASLARRSMWIQNVVLDLSSLFGFFIIALCVFFYNHDTRFPGIAAIPPVVGALLLIFAGNFEKLPVMSRLLSTRLFVRIGVLSFGLYLWHWPLLAMEKSWGLGESKSLLTRMLILGLSAVLAELSFRFLESPVRHGQYFKALPNRKIFLVAGAAVGFTILSGYGLRHYESSFNEEYRNFASEVERLSGLQTCIDDEYTKFPGYCTSDFSRGLKRAPRVILWGNSFTQSYLPMFEQFARDKHILLSAYWQGDGHFGASYSDDLILVRGAEFTKVGRDRNLAIIERIKALASDGQGPVSVVLSSRWTFYGGDTISLPDKNVHFLDRQKTKSGTVDVLRRTLEKTIKELKAAGISKILILSSYPEFKYPVLRCYKRGRNCDVSRAELDRSFSDTTSMIRTLAAPYEFVKIFDAVPFICDLESCKQTKIIGERVVPIVSDTCHPSVLGAQMLAPFAKSSMEWLISKDRAD
ncbi:MAG: hypothetical protein EOP06_08875, partial [Proteobacteria bacterium]